MDGNSGSCGVFVVRVNNLSIEQKFLGEKQKQNFSIFTPFDSSRRQILIKAVRRVKAIKDGVWLLVYWTVGWIINIDDLFFD